MCIHTHTHTCTCIFYFIASNENLCFVIIKPNIKYIFVQCKSKELEKKIYEMSNDEEKMKTDIEMMIQQGNALESALAKLDEENVKLQ